MGSRTINLRKHSEIEHKFYELLMQQKHLDCSLSAEGKLIGAHKVILSVSSGWFEVC